MSDRTPTTIAITSLRQLDAEVANSIFSWTIYREDLEDSDVARIVRTKNGGFFVPRFSENIEAAWLVVSKLGLAIWPEEIGGAVFWHVYQPGSGNIAATAEEIAIAICIAGLAAVGVEVELRLGE